MNEIIAAIIGAIIGAILATVSSEYVNKKRTTRNLLDLLRAELYANRRLAHNCLTINQPTYDMIPSDQRSNNNYTIDDETKVFVTFFVDSPLQSLFGSDVRHLIRNFPTQMILDYKLALYRINYLVDRNKSFRYRPSFLFAYIEALKNLLASIDNLLEEE